MKKGEREHPQFAERAAQFFEPRDETVFPFVRFGRLRMHPVAVTGTAPVECDLLIGSGSLIQVDAAEAVG